MHYSVVIKYLEKKYPCTNRYNGVLYFIGNVMYWEHKKALIPLFYIQFNGSYTHPNPVSEMMYIISTYIDEFKYLVFNSELVTGTTKFKKGYGYYNIVDNTVYTLFNDKLVKLDETFIDTVIKEIESLSEFVIVSEESSSSDYEELVVAAKEEEQQCSVSCNLNEDVDIVNLDEVVEVNVEMVKDNDIVDVKEDILLLSDSTLTDNIKNDILKMISNLISTSISI